MGNTGKITRVLRQEGAIEFLRRSLGYIYRLSLRPYVHTYLPAADYYTENEVKVDKLDIIDKYILSHYKDHPTKEGGLVSSHKSITQPGDTVVTVGGGKGITGVRAAWIVGKSGRVRIYEGGLESVQNIKKTSEMNGVSDRCSVHHGIVGEEKNVYGGDSTDAEIVAPEDIPSCDILELDCEGSEIEILEGLEFQPRGIIVELHPWNFSVEPEDPIELLIKQGYEVTHRFGHDGTPLSEEEFSTLLSNSKSRKNKYLETGARWPVIAALELTNNNR